MSRRYKGGVISATAPVPTGPIQTGTANGIWTLAQQLQSRAASTWPIAQYNSQSYTTAGTYTWVAPSCVTSVSVVAVGGGAGAFNNGYCCGCTPYYSGGGGGGLGYKNNVTVVPGNSYTVFVGNGGPVASGFGSPTRTNGQDSYFCSTSVVKGGGGRYNSGGTYTGTGGGNGGSPSYVSNTFPGGAGAGGYSGTGGDAGTAGSTLGKSGSGGGGGGGGYGTGCGTGGCGGGVGIFGQGSNGAPVLANQNGNPGSGGSGKLYGGGASRNVSRAGVGAVRIVYPGNIRQFPSTCVGSP